MGNRIKDLQQEISRDMWLAASAANQLAMLTPLAKIETELLEALAELCRHELEQRYGHDEIRRQ